MRKPTLKIDRYCPLVMQGLLLRWFFWGAPIPRENPPISPMNHGFHILFVFSFLLGDMINFDEYFSRYPLTNQNFCDLFSDGDLWPLQRWPSVLQIRDEKVTAWITWKLIWVVQRCYSILNSILMNLWQNLIMFSVCNSWLTIGTDSYSSLAYKSLKWPEMFYKSLEFPPELGDTRSQSPLSIFWTSDLFD